ncbi:MAG: hypothetical protein NVS1B2_04230 [Vulcanimicrobiaceae bacterium]
MFAFLKSLFNPPPPSSSTAKERLRLVLLSDHLSLSPETVQALKADLLAVISKYVEIDSSHADVTFEHRENEVAMLANIPITGVRERKRAIAEVAATSQAAAPPVRSVDPAPEITASRVASGDEDATDGARQAAPEATSPGATAGEPQLEINPVPVSPAAVQHDPVAASGLPVPGPHVPRRRRRKKAQAQATAREPSASMGKPAQA